MAILISQITVFIIGATVALLAAWGVFAPAKLMTWVSTVMDKDWGIYVAVIVRLILGVALIIAAPASPFPVVFQVFGAIAIIAAVALLLIGRGLVGRLIAWFSEQVSVATIRVWLLFGIAFGGFLIYGVL
ncbi:MAG: hypothetical protein KJO09_01295 [Gammaproteobacteria bacterium]|jgi:hypothetical protein|nr:hypothetical protein [Gammaproteobacteria bacterium]